MLVPLVIPFTWQVNNAVVIFNAVDVKDLESMCQVRAEMGTAHA